MIALMGAGPKGRPVSMGWGVPRSAQARQAGAQLPPREGRRGGQGPVPRTHQPLMHLCAEQLHRRQHSSITLKAGLLPPRLGAGGRFQGWGSLPSLLKEPCTRHGSHKAFWLNVYFSVYACAIIALPEKQENRFLKMLPTPQKNTFPALIKAGARAGVAAGKDGEGA